MSSVKTKEGFSIKTSFIIYATPEKVFEALTDTGIIAAWSGEIGVVGNKPGEKFELFDEYFEAKEFYLRHSKVFHSSSSLYSLQNGKNQHQNISILFFCSEPLLL